MSTRKTQLNRPINIPNKPIFTINDVIEANPHYTSQISLRVEFSNSIPKLSVIELGCINRKLGRPVKVYTKSPVSSKIIEVANVENITLSPELLAFIKTKENSKEPYQFVPKPRSSIIFE